MQLSPLFLALAMFAADPPVGQPGPVADGPIVRLKKTIQAEAGDLVEVTAESGAELVTWDSSDGLKVTYPKSDPAQKTVFIHTKVQGTYALTASIPNGKETRVAICLVQIGPRAPPPPPPPPPVPTFQSKVQDAFTADGSPVDAAAKLAALYRAASVTTVKDAGITTAAGLLTEMQRACAALIGPPTGTLAKSRSVIADELDKTLKNAGTLNPSTRDTIAALFVKVAEALEGVK